MFGQRAGFAGGIRLPATQRRDGDAMVRQLAFAPLLRLPLRQHAGPQCVAVARPGDEVLRGQLLARAADETGVPLHAPATGRVMRISEQPDFSGGTVGVIELAPLPGDTQEEPAGRPLAPDRCSADELLTALRESGLVGLGGEGGPTHLRLLRARQRGAGVVVLNGIEGEPGFCRVPALLAQHAADVVTGLGILHRVLGTQQAVLVVETPDAEAAGRLVEAAPDSLRPDLQILAPRYPQGAAELLLRVLAGRKLAGGRVLVADQAVVFSLASVAEIGRLLGNGRVMTDQLVTLAGDGLREPGNFRVPLGTPIGFALSQAGTQGELDRVLAGGPMRGRALSNLDRPIVKGVTGFVAAAVSPVDPAPEPKACIRCGECVAACPVQLHPAELGLLARRGEVETMVSDWHLERCFECGCCAYVCPSHIPLVQMFRAAKLQSRRARQLASAEVVT